MKKLLFFVILLILFHPFILIFAEDVEVLYPALPYKHILGDKSVIEIQTSSRVSYKGKVFSLRDKEEDSIVESITFYENENTCGLYIIEAYADGSFTDNFFFLNINSKERIIVPEKSSGRFITVFGYRGVVFLCTTKSIHLFDSKKGSIIKTIICSIDVYAELKKELAGVTFVGKDGQHYLVTLDGRLVEK